MKKIIFYCAFMFSSIIATAIIIHGCLLTGDIKWDGFIVYLFLIFLILIVLSIVLVLIEVYKKDKNNKE